MLSVFVESLFKTIVQHLVSEFFDKFVNLHLAEKLFNLTIKSDEQTADDDFFADDARSLKDCEWELEAHPIQTNAQLLQFDVRSRRINWKRLVTPLQPKNIQSSRYLGRDFNYMSNSYERVTEFNRREVLVCHDMMGNYLEDKHYRKSKKWDDYRFYHWAAIDYFNYFSHQYVSIPPCGWINAAHLHGVKVLGTFITEGNSGTQKLLDVLQSRAKIQQICDALVMMCEHFCFEGWLINIECNVPTDKADDLVYFVDTLRSYITDRIPNGVVFWYDSILHNGALSWQNEINDKNVRYFKASNAMLINYTWTDESLRNTNKTILQESQSVSKAFFGIDVFGRGQVAKFRCRETLARIVRENFSVGIFAPGWTFETLKTFRYNILHANGLDDVNDAFLSRNEKFWWLLWEHFATNSYTMQPFYTDFCMGSGKNTYSYGKVVYGSFFNLNRQSLQPSVPLHEFAERYYDDAVTGGCCLKILKFNQTFRLFVTDFAVDKAFIFAYAYKLNNFDGEIDCVLRFCESNNRKDCYLFCGEYGNTLSMQKGKCYLSPIGKDYYDDISQFMARENTVMKIPYNLENGWKVRYYGASFDNLVFIKDIGVLFRKQEIRPNANAYLGALYFNSFSMQPVFDRMVNWAHISNEYVLTD